ncbi:MAG: penicillin-insensitive murein endopeptidase [Chromatiaceae bacterium]|nr:penicillin-insensitive murein endopeptidase [Chromatiaceae bacterium]
MPPSRPRAPLPSRPWRALLLGVGLLLMLPAALASPWAKVKVTAPGPAAAIGGAANGCIAGAEALPAHGEGYVSIRRERNRYYGHPATLELVRDLGRTLAGARERLIMVGDLAQPRGGLMSSSHRSHQNGLDVDVWFALADSARAAWKAHPEGQSPPSMVHPDGRRLSPAWGPEQRLLIKAAAEHPRTDRIFVNPAIKQALCESERGDRAWLQRLRPWRGHDAHFHVRIRCPADSRDCEPQAPLPAGDGCGAELAWWFSEESRQPAKPSKTPPPPPPAACRALLGEL